MKELLYNPRILREVLRREREKRGVCPKAIQNYQMTVYQMKSKPTMKKNEVD